MKKLMGKGMRRWFAAFMALLMIVGIMPTDWTTLSASAADTTTFTGGTPVADGTWAGWTWSTFGNSTSASKNTIKDNGSSVTLTSTGGKIASGNEGINFLYKEISADIDFVITAKVKLDTWTVANQCAWGLMVRAAVGTHGNTAEASPLNSAAVGGYSTVKSSVATEFAGWTRLSSLSPISGSSGTAGTTYLLTIQKSGSKITMLRDNKTIGTLEDAGSLYSNGKMYVGLFTARTATATFSDVSFDTVAGTTHTINVGDKTLPKKTVYIEGNTLSDIDLTGFSASVTIDGTAKTITAADCIVKSANFDTAGASNIVLDYYGTEISIPVSVEKEVVSSIDMKYAPVKTDYYVGEAFDYSGLDAAVVYNSGRTFSLKGLLDGTVTSENSTTSIKITDPDTGLDTDEAAAFTTAGKKKVYINHEFGGVTKGVSFDVMVSEATVSSISISGPNQTTFYKDVTVAEDAYKKGLLVTATFSDGSKKVMSEGFTVESVGDTLDVTKVGTYEYKVTYGGQTANYTLRVDEKKVTGLEITTLPNKTNYVKGESFDSTGLVVNAVYDSGEKTVVADPSIDSSEFKSDEVGEYTIKVSATVTSEPLETTFVVAVREKTSYEYSDLTWKSIRFGQSIKTDDSQMSVKEEGGKVIIEAKEGVGKCTDDGQDGIAYYYTELDGTKDNFEITATITVDYFITKKSPDNQEGFGIMVRDAIGTDGDSSIFYSNAMSVGGYYGAFNVFGREGVNSQDDTTGKVNYTLKSKGSADQVKADAPRTFTITLKKDNSGVYATMKENGSVVNGIDGTQLWYLSSDAFTKQTDTMYVGFMAARGAKIEVDTSSIRMTITDRNADAPQTTAPAQAVTPKVTQGSLSTTADEDYTYIVNVNTKGLLTVRQNSQTIVSQKAVEAGTYGFDTKLVVGSNKFQVYFEPDTTQNLTSTAAVIMNATVTRKLYGTTKEPIYASAAGTESGDGTKDSPLDIQTAIDYCQIGQAVYLLPGTYNLTKTTGVWKYNNGVDETGRKYLQKDPSSSGDVIIDFGGSYADGKFVSNTFDISGDYWTIEGIKFANGGGVRVGGDHNIIMNCEFYGHCNSGLSISRTDGATDKADWPSYNQIIGCSAYENRDKSDNNADGFAAKLTCGEGNVFKNCIAAYNADDGWDLFSKGGTGAIGAVTIYDSVCFANGYTNASGTLTKTKGDGNGFKMGGSGIAVNHKVYNSYSFGNKANGFTNNSDPMGTYVNCTGYNNGGSNLELHVYTGATPQFTISGFKSYADGTLDRISSGEYTDKESKVDVIKEYYSASNFFRDKDGADGKSVNITGMELTAANFASLSEFVSIMTNGVSSIRSADGSVNLGNFLKYVASKTDDGGSDSDDDDSWDDDDSTVSGGSVIVKTKVDDDAVPAVKVDESLKDAVGFTPSEINKINNGTSASVTLEIKDISDTVSDADKQAVLNAAAGIGVNYKVGMYLDLSVIKTVGNTSTKIANLTSPVKVSIELPDSLVNTEKGMHREYRMIRIHDGQIDVIDTEFDTSNNTLSFYSDKFSTYAVVYSDAHASAPQTGDTAPVSMYGCMMLISVIALGYTFYCGYRRKREDM